MFRLRRGAQGLALSAALAAVAAGCSQPAAAPAGPAAATGGGAGAESSAPVQPKVNRVVLATAPPATAESNDNRMIGQIDIFQLRPQNEYLVGYNAETGKYEPELATEWALGTDGRSYSFKLRKGVQFHRDNGEFTVKDLLFTHEQEIMQDSLQVEAPFWKRVIQKFEVINDYEVRLQLDPEANFLHGISRAEAGMEIRSKASFEREGPPSMQGKTIAGTGPYEFESRQQGQYVRYKRVAYKHWRTTPDFPEFEFRWMREPSTRLAALLAGEIHIAALPQDLTKQAETQGMKTIRGRVPGSRIFFNPQGVYVKDLNNLNAGYLYDTPLTDVRVRKALQKAVNIDEINKTVFGGKGEVMYHTVLHPTRPGWDPKFEREFKDEYGYDPEAAKKLLAEAGFTAAKPLETSMHLAELAQFPGTADVSETVANYWRAIGVKVNLLTLDAVQRGNLTRQLKFENHWLIDGTSSDVLAFLQTRWGPSFGGGGNPGHGGRHPEVTRLYQALRTEMNEDKMGPLFRGVGDEGWKQHLSLNLLWLQAEAVVNPKIVGDYVFPGSISGTWTHVENIKAAK